MVESKLVELVVAGSSPVGHPIHFQLELSDFKVAARPAPMNGVLLQLTAVTKSFGAVRALKGVSFDLRAGEVHALLGENGAGKSTLIKVITGAHPPDGGSMEVNGRRAPQRTPAAAHKLGIACMCQRPALFPALSAAENIALRLEPATALRRVDWRARR